MKVHNNPILANFILQMHILRISTFYIFLMPPHQLCEWIVRIIQYKNDMIQNLRVSVRK